jgi:ADP-heptose:LPS heptosyltransferase
VNDPIITISIACFNKADVTNKCIRALEETLGDEPIEYIFIDNGSTDETRRTIYRANLPNKIYFPIGLNIGFGRAHNEALKIARSPYFIVLNNDMMMKQRFWAYKMAKILEDDYRVGLVGLQGNPSELRPDGHGTWGDRIDYIEASCIAGRTEELRKFGLFSPTMKMFYCEDSDLSLRFKQMGYELKLVEIPHDHARGTTANTIDQSYKNRMLVKNCNTLIRRWNRYLSTKEFTNKILVRANSAGGGDILAMTPVLQALRNDHPTADIEVETNWPDFLENNPFITSVHGTRRSYKVAYDRVIDFNLNYSSKELICKEAEKVAATEVQGSRLPQLFLTREELEEGKRVVEDLREKMDTQVIMGVCLQMARERWQGRNWKYEYAKELTKLLREAGIGVIELGKGVKSTEESDLDLVGKTSLREMFSIVANLDYYVGIDSLIFHVAQAFSTPSFILFGATEPIARVVDFTKTFVIRNESLPCRGCYQKKGKSDSNVCYRRDEACMQDLTPDVVFSHITGEIDRYEANITYLQDIIRDKG